MTDADLQEILSEIPGDQAAGIKQELVDQFNAKAVRAEARQDAIAADHAAQPLRSMEGIGSLTLSIDPQIYHWWRVRVPGCWQDSDFVKWFKRNFPQCSVKCGGTGKTMLLMPGWKTA